MPFVKLRKKKSGFSATDVSVRISPSKIRRKNLKDKKIGFRFIAICLTPELRLRVYRGLTQIR